MFRVPLAAAFCLAIVLSSSTKASAIDPAKAKWPVAALAAELERGSPEARMEAATFLTLRGPEAKAAVPALVRSLGYGHPGVRQFAAGALGKVAAGEPEVVAALVQTLGDEVWNVRSEAARALGVFGPKAKSAVDALRPLLKHEQGYVCIAAAKSLWSITSKADEAVGALVETLDDSDAFVVSTATEALAEIGPPAAAARPRLMKLVEQEGDLRPRRAVEALGKIGGPADELVPLLLPRLESDDRDMRQTAALALILIAPSDARVAEKLDAIFADDQAGWAVAVVLGKSGPGALPLLRKQLRSTEVNNRRHAAVGIREMGPAAAAALDDLFAALSDQNASVRRFVVEAIGAIGTDDSNRIQKLVDAAAAEFEGLVLEKYSAALAGCGPAVVGPLAPAIRSTEQSDSKRSMYFRTLKLLGPDARPLAPAVAGLVDTKDSGALYNSRLLDDVLNCLVEMGPGTPELAELAAAVVDARSEAAVRVLTRLGKQAKPAVPGLLRLLREHPRYSESADALEVLGNIGDASPEVIAAVEAAVEHHPLRAKTALLRLGRRDPALLAAVVNFPETENGDSFGAWVDCVRLLGPDAKAAAPKIEARLGRPDYLMTRIGYAEALYAIDPDRLPAALKLLVAVASAGDHFGQSDLLRALPNLGPKAAGTADFAAGCLTASDNSLRTQAAITLALLVPERFPEAFPVLDRSLDGTDPSYARVLAARGAAQIGEPARRLLEKAARSPDVEVRLIAARALRNLGSQPK